VSLRIDGFRVAPRNQDAPYASQPQLAAQMIYPRWV